MMISHSSTPYDILGEMFKCCPSRVRHSRTLPATLSGVTSAGLCKIIEVDFKSVLFFFNFLIFIVIQLQLYAFSPPNLYCFIIEMGLALTTNEK